MALILSQLRLTVFRLRGLERSGGRPLTVMVLGADGSRPFLVDRIFSHLDAKEKLGTVFIGRVRHYLTSLKGRPDIIVVHADEVYRRLFKKQGFAHLPEWVSFRFDLSKPPEQTWREAKNKNLQENLRRIRKHEYTYAVTHDPAQFDFFYRNMYLPYIPRKYGGSAELVGPEFMRLFFESGLLLLVKRGEDIVSGSVIIAGAKVAKAMVIGVRDGKEKFRREGALAACYYFTTLWARDRGYSSMDFGECRPLLDDGLFYFKKRWGMRLERCRHRRNFFGIALGRPSAAALDFLAANPFIILEQGHLEGRVLAGFDHSLSAIEVAALVRSHLVPGLVRLGIVSLNGFEPGVEKTVTERHAERVALVHGPGDAVLS